MGSLANLISGIKSPDASTESKLFRNVTERKDVNIKFQALHESKKRKRKKKITEDDSPVGHKKRQKIINRPTTDSIEPEPLKSSSLCAMKRMKKKRKREIEVANQDITKEREARSIFVGNVPHTITTKKLRKLFEKFGPVESVRLRCPPLADPRVPKKVAVIKKDFHPDRNSMHAFVRFVNTESARNALVFNGTVFEDHHIRVDMAAGKANHDQKKAVFLGNVPFAAEEDDLWKMFESCGKISGIRLIRDKRTGVGKGFAYINFESADAVELALKLDGEELNKRKLRVQRCIKKPVRKSGSSREHKHAKDRTKQLKTNSNEQTTMKEHEDMKNVLNDPDSDTVPKRIHTTPSQEFPHFQGQKVAEDEKLKKKKKKIKKAELKKIAVVMKLGLKSKAVHKKVKKPVLKIKSLAKKIK